MLILKIELFDRFDNNVTAHYFSEPFFVLLAELAGY